MAESFMICFSLHQRLPKLNPTRQSLKDINTLLLYTTLHRDKFCAYLVFTPNTVGINPYLVVLFWDRIPTTTNYAQAFQVRDNPVSDYAPG
jgi:hypothetical protein